MIELAAPDVTIARGMIGIGLVGVRHGPENAAMTSPTQQSPNKIQGHISLPDTWTVFGPLTGGAPAPSAEVLRTIPVELREGDGIILAQEVVPTRGQFDFRSIVGDPPHDPPLAVLIFVPLESPTDQEVTIGIGADWFGEMWLDGKMVFDTLDEGNLKSPPSIDDHSVDLHLTAGSHVLAIRVTCGRALTVLALGGPDDLRGGDFVSIIPPRKVRDGAELLRDYPADPEAPLRWIPPAGFDPRIPGLGFEPLEEAEHFEFFHARRSTAAIEDGGTGYYESLHHGTWNHVPAVTVFRDRMIAYWRNHVCDEGGPGTRILGQVGKILSETGEVDWGSEDDVIECAPAPVLARRRKLQGDRDQVRGGAARGNFQVLGGRLFFIGHHCAKHGITTDEKTGIWEGHIGGERLIPSENFFFGHGPAGQGGNVEWELGLRFFQEWDVCGDKLEPVTPLYIENKPPTTLAMTPDLTMPLEPFLSPYAEAPLLSTAPSDFQELVRSGSRIGSNRVLKYRQGTRRLSHDGMNGLTHGTEFQRPDGVWIALRELKYPAGCALYYAAEKSADGFYPPARSTNLYGSANPAGGELPDGRVYVIGNSPNRRNMFIHLSRDGKLFDQTRSLLHRQLKDYTPGVMKREGGPGSGPQYFSPIVIGESLWIAYSISKEHIGATRVPIAALPA